MSQISFSQIITQVHQTVDCPMLLLQACVTFSLKTHERNYYWCQLGAKYNRELPRDARHLQKACS